MMKKDFSNSLLKNFYLSGADVVFFGQRIRQTEQWSDPGIGVTWGHHERCGGTGLSICSDSWHIRGKDAGTLRRSIILSAVFRIGDRLITSWS